jgi:ketosteroid isomerase-like protein
MLQKIPTLNSTTNNRTLDVAQRGFAAFQHGWETGDFAPYIALLADDFTFWFPAAKHRGKYAGREGREHMVAKCHEHTEAGDRLTFSLNCITSNDTTVMFEFDSKGTISGKPYQGRNAISLDVSGDRISGFREYFGDIG